MRPADETALHEVLEARGRFGHREHLELAWTYLSRYTPDAAEPVMTEAIRRVAARHGAPDRYHDTITRSWLRLVAVHRARSDAGSFDAFIAQDANRGLLDRHLLAGHYSSAVLFSDAARREWAPPDLRPLPTPA